MHTEDAREPLSAAPAVDENRHRLLLATLRGQLLCYSLSHADRDALGSSAQRKLSMQIVWSYSTDALAFSAPVVDAASGMIVLGSANGGLHVLDAEGASGSGLNLV